MASQCQKHFNFFLIKPLIDVKTAKFLQKFSAAENYICHLFHKQADRQISKIRRAYDLKETSTAIHISAEINWIFFPQLNKLTDILPVFAIIPTV